jgi:hypothetical protein
MIRASVYLPVFMRNLLMHLAEKILPLHALTFGGDYPTILFHCAVFPPRPFVLKRNFTILNRCHSGIQCAEIHLLSVAMPTPRSSAVCLREGTLARVIRPAS